MGLMTASGGLTKSKLEQATAAPADVVAGETFYAGGKELKTGALIEQPAVVEAQNPTLYEGQLYYRIPFGAYRSQSGQAGHSEARAAQSTVLSALNAWTVVDLGTGTSFNVSRYSGYRNFTASNFIVELYGSHTAQNGNYNIVDGQSYYGRGTAELYKSYNSSNGVLTAYVILKGTIGHAGWEPTSTKNCTVRAYLRYRP